MNEAALSQMEHAHENFKAEVFLIAEDLKEGIC